MAESITVTTQQHEVEVAGDQINPAENVENTPRFTGDGFLFGGVNAPGISTEPGAQYSKAGREQYPQRQMVNLPIRN